MEAKTPPDYLSKKDVSRMFGVSLNTVNAWVKNDAFKAYGFPNSNRVFFKREEVEEGLIQFN